MAETVLACEFAFQLVQARTSVASSIFHNMASRTPSPDYYYPANALAVQADADEEGQGDGTFACPVYIVYVYEMPLAAPGWHPEHLGALLAASRFEDMPWLTAEVNRFVGWLLELLLLPPHRSTQMRRRLGVWQRLLQRRCRNVRLEWFQAMAIYGLELRQE